MIPEMEKNPPALVTPSEMNTNKNQADVRASLNKRTLKKRINRTVYMTSFASILLFSIAVLICATILLKPISLFASNLISNTVAREMNAEAFLRQYSIGSLTEFNSTDEKSQDWVRSMESITKLESYLQMENLNIHNNSTEFKKDPDMKVFLDTIFDLFHLHIEIEGKSIYSNREQLIPWDGFSPIEWLLRLYTVESSQPLLNKEQVEIGKVSAMVAPQFMLILFFALAFLSLFLMFIALLISRLIGRLFAIPLLKPIDQLIIRMNEISMESMVSGNQIILNKPLQEIEQLANATNLIMNKMADYSEKLQQQKNVLEAQNEELEAQNEELATSELRLQEAQKQLILSGNSMRNLLNNAGQGFLTFGSNLLVDPEYSNECRQLFGEEIQDKSFSVLISLGDLEQERFLNSLLHKLFTEKDKHKRSIYFPLLSEEIILNHRYIHLDYKMIQGTLGELEESIMVIMTDITEKRELQSQMETERLILKMVVKVIVNYGDFMDCVRDFKQFYEVELNDLLLKNESVKSKLLTLFRDIHTYKGNFSQFGLTYVVQKLHASESEMSELIKIADSLNQEELFIHIRTLRIHDWLGEDMDILFSILGESFFNQEDLLMVDKSKIMEIERKMLTLLSPNECKMLIPDLRKLRFKSFKELLKAYPEYVEGLADRMEKFIEPIEITGGDFLADTEQYYDFSRSLIHVFRNIIDHAIEGPEERVLAGKKESATIHCRIMLIANQIVIELADDGVGIDPTLIRRNAISKGIGTEEEIDLLSDQAVVELVFHDEFSTKSLIDDVSGRGIGLSSVKAEVEKLQGQVEVMTEVGRGTTFRFTFPYEELSSFPDIEYPHSLQPCIEITKKYLTQFAHLSVHAAPEFELLKQERLKLKKVTSFVGFRGAIEGIFVITVDEPLLQEMVKVIVLDPVAPEEMEVLVEDTLAETSNIILGNSIRMFEYFADFMIMDPPITIFTEGASIRYNDSDIWTCALDCEHGTMQICFVIMKRG